jgi:hypothetical protein
VSVPVIRTLPSRTCPDLLSHSGTWPPHSLGQPCGATARGSHPMVAASTATCAFCSLRRSVRRLCHPGAECTDRPGRGLTVSRPYLRLCAGSSPSPSTASAARRGDKERLHHGRGQLHRHRPWGTIDRGNGEDGLCIKSADNLIGGPANAAQNIISGNNDNGVLIDNIGTSGTKVLGNYIGLNRNGFSNIGNTLDGVRVSSMPLAEIGGTLVGQGKTISDNGQHGVEIAGYSSTNTKVLGNRSALTSTEAPPSATLTTACASGMPPIPRLEARTPERATSSPARRATPSAGRSPRPPTPSPATSTTGS